MEKLNLVAMVDMVNMVDKMDILDKVSLVDIDRVNFVILIFFTLLLHKGGSKNTQLPSRPGKA
jgi:hypothetical protein